jgi:hypothetical protein
MRNPFRRQHRVLLTPEAHGLLLAYAEALEPDLGIRLTADQAAERLVRYMLGNDNLLAVVQARLASLRANEPKAETHA